MAPCALPRCPALPLSSCSSHVGPVACQLKAVSAPAAAAHGPAVPSPCSAPRVPLRLPRPSWPVRGDMAFCGTFSRPAESPSISRRRMSCRALDEEPAGSGPGAGSGSAESLFARELRKRGLSSGSSQDRPGEAAAEGGRAASEGGASVGPTPGADPSPPPSGGTRTAGADWAEGQRERSSALNSEGLEGLPARAAALIRLGASFYFNLWPLALLLVGAFLAVYLAWGTDFIHAGKPSVTAPAYIDPYELLRQEEELLPMVPFRPPPDPPVY